MEQPPSVGRVVHYYTANPSEQSNGAGEGPYPAIITRVWSPDCVNLKVLPDCGPVFDTTSVQTKLSSSSRYWEWPPRV